MSEQRIELSPHEMLVKLYQMGFTEEAIARGLHVSQPTVSRLLNGKTIAKYAATKVIEELFEKYWKNNKVAK